MRLRLEREQGDGNPLKAGRGGYYDADFALMYLRLKGAGLFFKSLNTPERIDIVEKMGHLERPDAEFLRFIVPSITGSESRAVMLKDVFPNPKGNSKCSPNWSIAGRQSIQARDPSRCSLPHFAIRCVSCSTDSSPRGLSSQNFFGRTPTLKSSGPLLWRGHLLQ